MPFRLLLVLCVLGSSFAEAGIVFVSTFSGLIQKYDADTGAFVGTFAPNSPQISNRFGLAFDRSGNLYAGNSNGTIEAFAPDGTRSVFANLGIANVTGIAFDSNGNLFAGSLQQGTIFKISPSGTVTTFVASPLLGGGIYGMAFDRNGNLFVGSLGTSRIIEISPSGTPSIFAEEISQVSGLAFDSGGNLYAGENGTGKILKFTPGGLRSTFADEAGENSPLGLAFDNNGTLLVGNGGTSVINKIATDGTVSLLASVPGVPGFMAFPVPEPSSVVASLLGLGVLATRRRRRRR